MALRVLSDEERDQYLEEVDKVKADLKGGEEHLQRLNDAFERDLVLVGATCVEDRLQDEVPETIADLQKAGIKVWMLTGDKLETAENIGFSCRLLTNEMEITKCSTAKDIYDNFNEETVKQNE